jgi:hypothetical protein
MRKFMSSYLLRFILLVVFSTVLVLGKHFFMGTIFIQCLITISSVALTMFTEKIIKNFKSIKK